MFATKTESPLLRTRNIEVKWGIRNEALADRREDKAAGAASRGRRRVVGANTMFATKTESESPLLRTRNTGVNGAVREWPNRAPC